MRNITYCDFGDFGKQYRDYVHGYLSISVCVFGSLANIFNICVLRTKNMRSPTNCILTGLALADLLVMLQYIPFTIHRNMSPNPLHYTHLNYSWAIFYKFHSLFTLVLHFIACSLTIILAVWRTVLVIVLTYVMCPLVCFPILFTLEITPYQQACTSEGIMVDRGQRHKYNSSDLRNQTVYVLYPNDPYNLSIWIYTMLLKFVPCVLLTLLSYKIIYALIEARRRRMKLLSGNKKLAEDAVKKTASAVQVYRENQADRTTHMLLAVLILFLVTEFPQAILGLISAVLGEVFLEECYAPLGDVMDIMALINSSITFILYCTMSRQFRTTFQDMFHLKEIFGWIGRPSSRSCLAEETRAETKMSLV
ncbi:G-protein coupled receptor dmsr-1-like isoform X2 [Euwallacea similis]|uniref:G-protein coupled receptor dmsr-1-like isoform X2 n=1 Tax=Euwallacea similis TaxID=1736056 RepID=UPI00344FC7F6